MGFRIKKRKIGMLAITNNHQQNPTFQQRQLVKLRNLQLVKKLEEKGISPSIATLAGLGSAGVITSSAIATPEAANFTLIGSIMLILGAMFPMVIKKNKKSERCYEVNDSYLGHVFLTRKGMKQYSRILKKIEPLQCKAHNLRAEAEKCYQQWYGRTYQYCDTDRHKMNFQASLAEQKICKFFTNADKELFIKDGEL